MISYLDRAFGPRCHCSSSSSEVQKEAVIDVSELNILHFSHGGLGENNTADHVGRICCKAAGPDNIAGCVLKTSSNRPGDGVTDVF